MTSVSREYRLTAPVSFSRWLAIPLRRMELFLQRFGRSQLVRQEIGKAGPLTDDLLFPAHRNDSAVALEEVTDVLTVREMAATKVEEPFRNAVLVYPSSGGCRQVMT